MAGMIDGIKNSAANIAKSVDMEKAKTVVMETGKKLAADAVSKQLDKLSLDKLNPQAKLAEAVNKISNLGVKMFNPTDVVDVISGDIKKAMSERLDLHSKLDGLRNKLEKEKEKADFNILSNTISDLASRTQNTISTAVVDGMINTLTPDSIKNPTSNDSDTSINSDDSDTPNDSDDKKEKKGFFDVTADLFDKAKGMTVDLSQSVLKESAGSFDIGGVNLGSVVGDVITSSPGGLTSVVGSIVKSANGLDVVTTNKAALDAVGGFLKHTTDMITGVNPLGGLPPDADEESIRFNNMLGRITNISSVVTSGVIAYGSIKEAKHTTLEFKNSIDVIKQDFTGVLMEKAIENSIASLNNPAKNVGMAIIGSAAKQITSVFVTRKTTNEAQDQTQTINDEYYTTTSDGAIASAICHKAMIDATKQGDTAAVQQLVVEAPLSFCAGKRGCIESIKNSKQTPENIIDTLVTANLLDINLNEVDVDKIKTPDMINNLAEDDTKQINDNVDDATSNASSIISLDAFKEIIKGGANYAKTLLGINKYKECSSLLEIQQQYSNIA